MTTLQLDIMTYSSSISYSAKKNNVFLFSHKRVLTYLVAILNDVDPLGIGELRYRLWEYNEWTLIPASIQPPDSATNSFVKL